VQIWLALLTFAVINGFFRQRVLEPELGEELAHILSTTTLCGAVFVAAVFLVGNRPRLAAPRDLFIVGLGWATATAITEVVLRLMAGGTIRARAVRGLRPDARKLFALVVLTELCAPPLVGWLRRWAEQRASVSLESRVRR
jgi:hypothetical protein